MDLTGIPELIAAISGTGALAALWKAGKAAWREQKERGRREEVERQTLVTLDAVTRERDEYKAESERLWALLEGLTT